MRNTGVSEGLPGQGRTHQCGWVHTGVLLSQVPQVPYEMGHCRISEISVTHHPWGGGGGGGEGKEEEEGRGRRRRRGGEGEGKEVGIVR